MGVSSLLHHVGSGYQACKHLYLLSHFNSAPSQRFELNTVLVAGRPSPPPRTYPRDYTSIQNANSQTLLETNCKIYFRAAGVYKGTSCLGAVGLWPWWEHTFQGQRWGLSQGSRR